MSNAIDIDALRPFAEAELARRRLMDFCCLMNPSFARARHLTLLANSLERVERREIRRLIVEMPPRHGKTETASVNFPAWCLGRNPRSSIVLASYGSELAEQNSRRVREIVNDVRFPFTGVKLRDDSRAVNRWATTAGGMLLAAGVGSGLTGFGADGMLVDDPVRDREAADSALIRESTWSWFQDVARTRLHPGAFQVVISTRWHEDDLVGRILASSGAGDWTVLCFPAICDEADDPLGREIGETLWPERFPISEIPSPERGEISTRSFSALYQQRPSPAQGAIFKREWFQNRYAELPDDTAQPTIRGMLLLGQTRPLPNIIATGVDCASKTAISNDFTVFVTVLTDGKNYYIVDVVRARLEFTELLRRAVEVHDEQRPRALVIEDTSSGIPLIQTLRGATNIPIIAVQAKGSKDARAEAISVLFESGRVLLPKSAPWLDAFIEEFCTYPASRHDDQIDATHHAIRACERAAYEQRLPIARGRLSAVASR